MNLETFASQELELAGLFNKDSDYGGMLGGATMSLIKVFAEEGHSGFSANMAISIFSKVAAFEPLTPLTGEDSEWNEVGTNVYQNKRCSHVFKEKGQAYDSQGRVFVEPSGATYTSFKSRVLVTFPYIPKTEYVNVDF